MPAIYGHPVEIRERPLVRSNESSSASRNPRSKVLGPIFPMPVFRT